VRHLEYRIVRLGRRHVCGEALERRTGADSELRAPVGVALVGGLLVSQVLTLFTTPVIYLYLDGVSAADAASLGR
jgi:hypothetical protein